MSVTAAAVVENEAHQSQLWCAVKPNCIANIFILPLINKTGTACWKAIEYIGLSQDPPLYPTDRTGPLAIKGPEEL